MKFKKKRANMKLIIKIKKKMRKRKKKRKACYEIGTRVYAYRRRGKTPKTMTRLDRQPYTLTQSHTTQTQLSLLCYPTTLNTQNSLTNYLIN